MGRREGLVWNRTKTGPGKKNTLPDDRDFDEEGEAPLGLACPSIESTKKQLALDRRSGFQGIFVAIADRVPGARIVASPRKKPTARLSAQWVGRTPGPTH
jgi:hypothetical protein